MNKKTVPFTSEQLENIIAQYPTPFHIYDEEGIIENMKSFINAFSWNKGFKQYFAVKATPNPYIMRLLQKLGVGADCSSLAELLYVKKWVLRAMILCSHLMTHRMWSIKRHLKWVQLSILMILHISNI